MRDACAPLADPELNDLRQAIAAVAGPALAHVEVLRPEAHAVAVTLRVDEPHAFLRHRLRDLLAAAGS